MKVEVFILGGQRLIRREIERIGEMRKGRRERIEKGSRERIEKREKREKRERQKGVETTI